MAVHNMHLLAPGERFQPWPKPPAPPNPPQVTAMADPTDCEGCGAPLQHHLAACAWCTRPHPSRRADLGALLEVTCMDDVAPRYVVGWEPTRPVPPPSRLVRDGDLESVRRIWEERYSEADPFPFPHLKRFCRWVLGVR